MRLLAQEGLRAPVALSDGSSQSPHGASDPSSISGMPLQMVKSCGLSMTFAMPAWSPSGSPIVFACEAIAWMASSIL